MKKLILISSIILAGGCATPFPLSQYASDKEDIQAKEFQVPSNNTANLYVYRDKSVGPFYGAKIFIDNKEIATTHGKTYFVVNVSPGEHFIESYTEEKSIKKNFNVLPNSNNYIKIDPNVDGFGVTMNIIISDEKTGKSGVLQSKLIEIIK